MYGYPNPGSSNYMERCMRRWLAQAGYYRCTRCDTWKAGVGVSNKQCRPCHRRYTKERVAAQKAGTWIPKALRPDEDTDWGSKANAYFESQIDHDYYCGVQVHRQSPIASLAMRASLKPHASTGARRSMA